MKIGSDNQNVSMQLAHANTTKTKSMQSCTASNAVNYTNGNDKTEMGVKLA
jgi:hypothetical protein